jgi:hypothetical protein
MPERGIMEIRRFLGEPNKPYHYLKTANTKELTSKLRELVEMITPS